VVTTAVRESCLAQVQENNMPTHNRRIIVTGVLLLLAIAFPAGSRAACVPTNLATPSPRDPVARVLAAQQTCPRNAIEFRGLLKRSGARLEPTMVNFVGFHNPDPGAFFVFEIASGSVGASASPVIIQRGDLLFGHFTGATADGKLVPNNDGLVIELIAWDPDKQFYNFYELVDGTWFYRGDSKDILEDIQFLHRQRKPSERPFGARLRCSGCHVNGGLLQKELAAPHNDWFLTARNLPLGSLKPDSAVRAILADVVDAGELSKLVTASAQRLADSAGYQKVLAARSMQERLRPLFCSVEVNIESDSAPLDDRRPALTIPSGFFVDNRLGAANISVPRQHYDAARKTLHTRLPETPGRTDADHAWLAPVKAQSDVVAVDALIAQSVVNAEFVADVLAVDFTNPVFSKTRCRLLKLVPDAGGTTFVARFQDALRGASVPGAPELLSNLTSPQRDAAFHKKQALAFVDSCKRRASEPGAVLDWYRLLAQRRVEVGASEISQNSRGHILEDPGRIVFPSTQPAAAAGVLTLTPACLVQ
jgi:hypothetical protein